MNHDIQYRLWPFWTEPSEIERVTNAYCLAMHQHCVAAPEEKKTRKYNGKPYITHPVRVALATASHPQCRLPWICAAFLHDTIEDTVKHKDPVITQRQRDDLEQKITDQCGEDVLKLVIELTNEEHDKKLPRRVRKELDWKRLSAVSKPAKIIKMLDRIDNVREMTGAPIDFKRLYMQESLELLEFIKDGDKDIAHQLKTAIEYVYSWRRITRLELLQKPKGTVFEHSKGKAWIHDGKLNFTDGVSYSLHEDDEVFNSIMRETDEEYK